MKNKKVVYIGAGVVLLIVILFLVFSKKGNQSNPAFPTANEVPPAGAATSSATTPKKSSPQANQPLSATQRYLDAIRVYKSAGYYFQFVDCHGAPGSFTLKAGKKFMLDNRDGKAHKIAVQGGQTFQVKAYDFAIATAPSTVGVHYITCDGGGAAKIIVQK